MFYLNSTLNFGIPPVFVFQLEVCYKVDRLLTGITVQQKGTTAWWYSNKTSLKYHQPRWAKYAHKVTHVSETRQPPSGPQLSPVAGWLWGHRLVDHIWAWKLYWRCQVDLGVSVPPIIHHHFGFNKNMVCSPPPLIWMTGFSEKSSFLRHFFLSQLPFQPQTGYCNEFAFAQYFVIFLHQVDLELSSFYIQLSSFFDSLSWPFAAPQSKWLILPCVWQLAT